MKVPAAHAPKQSTTTKIFAVTVMNQLQVYHARSPRSFSQTTQISKAINSTAVSVPPSWLQCVAAYQIETGESKTIVGITHLRTPNIAEYVGFATASCTRACTPQRLEIEKRFRSIIPGNGQFVAYLLNVCRLDSHHSFCRLGRSPKIAVPTRTRVAPSSTAIQKSCVMPMERCGSFTLNSFSSESRSSRSCTKNFRDASGSFASGGMHMSPSIVNRDSSRSGSISAAMDSA